MHSTIMEEIHLNNWEKFESYSNERLSKYKRFEYGMHYSEPLFRGQSNSEWKLETTLERYGKRDCLLLDYYKSIRLVKSQIESALGKQFNLCDPNEFYFHPYEDSISGYEFMVYLRHHGFPSPLLDWTESPYIAAFFAFYKSLIEETDSVAIYCFQEYCGCGKEGAGNKPGIKGLGPTIATHKRHFLQKAQYTICFTKQEKEEDRLTENGKYCYTNHEYCYTNHEDVFKNPCHKQDKIVKFIIPNSENEKVLKKLNYMKINAYSLFENEESLMEVLAKEYL